jgi:hypothetical protein
VTKLPPELTDVHASGNGPAVPLADGTAAAESEPDAAAVVSEALAEGAVTFGATGVAATGVAGPVAHPAAPIAQALAIPVNVMNRSVLLNGAVVRLNEINSYTGPLRSQS